MNTDHEHLGEPAPRVEFHRDLEPAAALVIVAALIAGVWAFSRYLAPVIAGWLT